DLVGQQVDVIKQNPPAEGAEPRGQVVHLQPGQVGAEAVDRAIAQPADQILLAGSRAGADDHIVAVEITQQAADVGRVVLDVAVHNHDDLAAGRAHAGLDAGAVADVVGPGDDPGAGGAVALSG